VGRRTAWSAKPKGLVDPFRRHELNLTIAFDDHRQPFALYAHTWERGRLSGTAVWNDAAEVSGRSVARLGWSLR